MKVGVYQTDPVLLDVKTNLDPQLKKLKRPRQKASTWWSSPSFP